MLASGRKESYRPSHGRVCSSVLIGCTCRRVATARAEIGTGSASPPSLRRRPSSIIHLNNVICRAWFSGHARRQASLDPTQLVPDRRSRPAVTATTSLGTSLWLARLPGYRQSKRISLSIHLLGSPQLKKQQKRIVQLINHMSSESELT